MRSAFTAKRSHSFNDKSRARDMEANDMADELPLGFGPLHVIEPATTHTHTAIMLHGRGSTGPAFAEELSECRLSEQQQTLMQALPGCKWLFPSSRQLWSALFQENMTAWFEASSLVDTAVEEHVQVTGLRESVSYIEGIVRAEVDSLGSSKKVILGGISQGAAVGLWTVLSMKRNDPARCPFAFVGVSTWLPFAAHVEKLLEEDVDDSPGGIFVRSLISPLHNTHSPVTAFLGHGKDDAYVEFESGIQARNLLARLGWAVRWKEYTGAEQEGHWLKEPDELDDICDFLRSIL